MKHLLKTVLSLTLTAVLIAGCEAPDSRTEDEKEEPVPAARAEEITFCVPETTGPKELPVSLPEETSGGEEEDPKKKEETDPEEKEREGDEEDFHREAEAPVENQSEEQQETEPAVTVPEETEPRETESQAEAPSVTVPPETEPQETEPPETEPAQTEPAPTVPAETAPAPTEPAVTEPPAEKLDLSALEAYGRSYAYDTYGYEGDRTLGFSNAGYFPGMQFRIRTMEEGYAAARRIVDDQYRNDCSMGYPVVSEIDGVLCRAKLNIYFEQTDGDSGYTVYCFYR